MTPWLHSVSVADSKQSSKQYGKDKFFIRITYQSGFAVDERNESKIKKVFRN